MNSPPRFGTVVGSYYESPKTDVEVTSFLVAAALHQVEKVKFYVEERRFHPDLTRGGKPTAICYTAMKPHLYLMKYLLKHGADVNLADAMGMTPLHYAVLGGHSACVSALIAHGAVSTALNARGQSAADIAASRPNLPGCIRYLCSQPAASELH